MATEAWRTCPQCHTEYRTTTYTSCPECGDGTLELNVTLRLVPRTAPNPSLIQAVTTADSDMGKVLIYNWLGDPRTLVYRIGDQWFEHDSKPRAMKRF